jgi:hypothetical protein
MAEPPMLPLTEAEKDEQERQLNRSLLDMKREKRQEYHMLLWLEGKTYPQICAITGFGKNTVWEDLKAVQERWQNTPSNDANVRKLALMSLRITRAEILQTIGEAKTKNAKYADIAKLYDAAVDIDQTILQRYTQMPNESQAIFDAEERAKITIDFFIEKWKKLSLPGDALDGFEEYYQKRLNMRRVVPAQGDHQVR